MMRLWWPLLLLIALEFVKPIFGFGIPIRRNRGVSLIPLDETNDSNFDNPPDKEESSGGISDSDVGSKNEELLSLSEFLEIANAAKSPLEEESPGNSVKEEKLDSQELPDISDGASTIIENEHDVPEPEDPYRVAATSESSQSERGPADSVQDITVGKEEFLGTAQEAAALEVVADAVSINGETLESLEESTGVPLAASETSPSEREFTDAKEAIMLDKDEELIDTTNEWVAMEEEAADDDSVIALNDEMPDYDSVVGSLDITVGIAGDKSLLESEASSVEPIVDNAVASESDENIKPDDASRNDGAIFSSGKDGPVPIMVDSESLDKEPFEEPAATIYEEELPVSLETDGDAASKSITPQNTDNSLIGKEVVSDFDSRTGEQTEEPTTAIDEQMPSVLLEKASSAPDTDRSRTEKEEIESAVGAIPPPVLVDSVSRITEQFEEPVATKGEEAGDAIEKALSPQGLDGSSTESSSAVNDAAEESRRNAELLKESGEQLAKAAVATGKAAAAATLWGVKSASAAAKWAKQQQDQAKERKRILEEQKRKQEEKRRIEEEIKFKKDRLEESYQEAKIRIDEKRMEEEKAALDKLDRKAEAERKEIEETNPSVKAKALDEIRKRAEQEKERLLSQISVSMTDEELDDLLAGFTLADTARDANAAAEAPSETQVGSPKSTPLFFVDDA